ncbi:MAG: SUMF1/EgtB/PvdO family nonheme iron enzyme [Nitrolancea sp.]
MVLIPAGPFTMGSDDGPQSERPAHQVHVEAVWIDRDPVTVRAYAEFVASTGRPAPPSWRGGTPQRGRANYPVVDVTWDEARAFAAWAGKRLPTEAEWEKSAAWDDAAQHSRRWPWGDVWESGRANAGSGILAIFRNRGPNEVGRFSPASDSAFGVACMAGNVWEWTSSLFLPYPYEPRDGRENLSAAGSRVLRGGSWSNPPDQARCASRLALPPRRILDGVCGFRCALSAIDPPR